MKFLESNFIDYTSKSKENNMHPELESALQPDSITAEDQCNLIFYGPVGTGKYTQALRYIKPFSPSHLKYERKITINFQNKHEFIVKISDVHFEVDMELLGCNAKLLWNEIYNNILDILSARPNHTGIVVCKNFHKIHSELLDIFYSYLQTLTHRNVSLYYIFITEQISFLPDNILSRCQIIPVKRPTKNLYKKCISKKVDVSIKLSDIINIKDLKTKETQLLRPNEKIVGKIIEYIEDYENINFLFFRDKLYNIFIYHLDLNECIWQVINHFVEKGKINKNNIAEIFLTLYEFLKLYNNNYRPIYHLEKFMFNLCRIVHGL